MPSRTPAPGHPPGQRSAEVAAPPAAPRGDDPLAARVEAIRQVPGVDCVVVHRKDGGRASTGGASCPATPMEEESGAVARLGMRLGALFRTGDLVSGWVQGSDRNVLLLATRELQLTLLLSAGSDADAVQERVRALLGARG